MELIKMGNKYLVKDSGGKVIDEKERLELENKNLAIQDITSSGCVKEITKKISSNKKKIAEINAKEELKKVVDNSYKKMLNKEIGKVVENEVETIEETKSIG